MVDPSAVCSISSESAKQDNKTRGMLIIISAYTLEDEVLMCNFV